MLTELGFDAVDKSLGNDRVVVALLAGNFRQVLPVAIYGSRAQVMKACSRP
jgi:hypothetical protein